MAKLSRRHNIAGLATALGGTGLIFMLVVGINEFAAHNSYDDRPRQTAFDVSMPQERPEPLSEPEPPPEPQPEALEPPPPMAELDSRIGGVDIPVPGLDDRELDSLTGAGGGDGDLVMTDDTVDDPPKPVQQVAMEYPSSAKRQGVEGYVTLSLLISDRGDVERVRVLESNPPGVFDQAATQALRQWQFQPARYQGEAVRVWARQRIRFDLD